MTTDHERYAEWDGAYVMGALSRAERQEYEAHLASCDECAAAVGELGPLPGLLGRVSADEAELLLTPVDDELPAHLTERIFASARVPLPWWRRAGVRAGMAVAAAAVVAAAVVVPLTVRGGDHPDVTVALAAVRPSPLSADVSLTGTSWGTEVDMTCVYAAGRYPGGARSYGLYVVDAAGRASEVSSWHAAPGDTARTTGSTSLAVADIVRVQVRDAAGTVLLSASPRVS